MSYKFAFLGCGPRANGHAAAYQHITRGAKVACCDLDEDRLSAFSEKWGIGTTYADLDEMLDTEKPDVVHCVTRPDIRVPLLTKLADAGVPGVLIRMAGIDPPNMPPL